MTIRHVETTGAEGERDSITIPAAGSIKKIVIVNLRISGDVDKNIISWGIGVMEGLGDEA